MLQTIRERTQGWIAGIVIALIILTFILWSIHSYLIGGVSRTIVAKVNDVEVTKEQLAVAYERLRRQVQSNHVITVAEEAQLKNNALQMLIDIQVQKQASIQQRYRLSNQQIDRYLESMPEFQVDGVFSLERFQQVLSTTLLSTGEFLDLIKTSLLIGQPKLGIILTSFALPNETQEVISLVNQERRIQYVSIPLTLFLSQAISMTPERIRAYYQQHQNDFFTPEQVSVEYVTLSLKDLIPTIQPTDAVLRHFYNENINAYTRPTEWKLASIEVPVAAHATPEQVEEAKQQAEGLLQKVQAGNPFAKIAHSFPGKMLNDHQALTLSQIPAVLQKAVAGLNQPNQLSEVIRTDQGFVIVKVLGIKEAQVQPFEAVKSRVSDAYKHQRAEEKFTQQREQLANLAYEHPDSLQVVAQSLGLSIHTTGLFAKDKSGEQIAAYKQVRDTAFSHDVLDLQNNSDVIQINPEMVAVLRVKLHVPSTLLPLNGVAKQIEGQLKEEEARQRAATLAETIKSQLESGKSLEQISQATHLSWTVLGYMGRYATQVDSAILDMAFRLPDPTTIRASASYGVIRIPTGYAIVALKGIQAGTTDPKQEAIFSEQVQNSEGLLEYELYKLSQTRQAKIKIEK